MVASQWLYGTFLSFQLLCGGALGTFGSQAHQQLRLSVAEDLTEDCISSSDVSGKRAITPEISALAQRLMEEENIPGLTVGFIRVNEDSVDTEFGAWGNMTEQGRPVEPEVRI